jgi:micrococcal nuclease
MNTFTSRGSAIPTYPGQLWLIDQPDQRDAGAVEVSDERIDVSIRGQQIGAWSRSDVAFIDRQLHFEIEIGGEALGFRADDPDAFRAYLVGGLAALFEQARIDLSPTTTDTAPGVVAPPTGSWWRFWDRTSWSRWSSDRKAWLSYRASLNDLQQRISRVTTELASKQSVAAQLRRELAWVSAVAPRDLTLPLKRGETGLAIVEHVTLMELRKREGVSAWTPIDIGAVSFTDRRMVFSGDKSVTFNMDDITGARMEGAGLHVSVGRRKTSHVLAGPSEQLLTTLHACQVIVQGIDPIDVLRTREREASAQVAASEGELAQLKQAQREVGRPSRPFSPAWAPSLMLAIVFVGVSSIAIGQSAPTTETTALMPAPTVTSSITTEARAADATTTTTIEVLVPQQVTAEVASITDGDTIRVLLADGTNEPVRLIGIDAPEPEEPFGPEAAELLASLVAGQTVRLVPDISDRDQFDRLLRYVYVGGVFVNEAMVESGLAKARRYPPDVEMATILARAHDSARTGGRGQWATSTTTSAPVTTSSTAAPTTTTAPPPTTTQSTSPTSPPAPDCHPSYEGACVPNGVSDVDCAGGSGNGPYYVQGPVRVVGPDVYDLDGNDNDGIGCES